MRPLHVQRLRFLSTPQEWINAGREHSGMILGAQQRFSVGEQLRRILRVRSAVSPQQMRNRIEFLANWR